MASDNPFVFGPKDVAKVQAEKPAVAIALTAEERAELEELASN